MATTPGTYNFIIAVTSAGNTVPQACTVKITALTLKDTFNVPNAFLNTLYNYALTPLGAAGPVSFTATTAMPPGLNLSSAGVISGTPTSTGQTTVNFSFTDGIDTTFRSFQINVFTVRYTTPGVLPNATQNVPYNTSIVAAGGTGSFTYTTPGGLPGGLSLSSSGVISGTTTTGPGRYGFSVTATDTGSASYTRTFSIDVIGVPATLATVNLGNVVYKSATIGFGYSRLVNAINGGVAPFTWTATGLPPGLSIRGYDLSARSDMTPDDAEVWGTPTQTGAFNVVISATDANGAVANAALLFNISTLGVDGIDTLPGGAVGTPYSKKLRVIGGTGPYTVSPLNALNQPLPAGLSLNSGAFLVSGTPLEGGNFTPNFRFQDAAGSTVDLLSFFTITNGASTITINQTFNLGTTTIGSGYGFQLSACCTATNSFTWSLQSGTPPP
ncbi:MAG TPA: putative Ig domain-containing protein, partial [Tepidisphaeraceae bacterium]|nr:putative Ig domain-containing protein [Tepidisphaeraceae bacterium]